MNLYRKTSIIIGALFIIGTAAGITGAVITSSSMYAPDYLQKISANQIQMTLGALLVWLMGFSLALVPIFLYPIVRKQNEILAIGYVVFRGALETITYIAIGICMLLLSHLSQDFVSSGALDPSRHQIIGSVFLKARELCTLSTVFVFSIGALMFYVLLFQSKLIPHWLSVWGIIAIALHITTGFLMMFGVQIETSVSNSIMNFPIFLQEMVMAVWLIVRGFNPGAINLLSEKS